ncbi:sodium:solute symporter [Coraliomargarita sp. SDUM461004]|uniref:Sodium:solute symporter n=1 Tax=Thalassobacterium sedimentorum TaxID=3041258 RepID=A0ABU1AHG6_9BACT|nr:sodium:solute symporter [Coraliomargarita sp. SDUM461004]MDQ8194174.1 sodium:solute symporter [Coraliomargarita sp. SDUM461004]
MSSADWIVLFATVLGIVGYGLWTARRHQSANDYLRGGADLKWSTIGLSVMATQASAITFLSTPGQGYEGGLAFVQNYLGLPIAMILICAVFIPIYHRLQVTTAYEFLGQRFDQKTRLLAAGLFLVQRGLAAGITIYAPAIIVSSVFYWPLGPTILVTGILVILYTVTGGTRTVSLTQKYQMLIILIGMTIAFGYVVNGLPENVSFGDALYIAGMHERLEAISFSFDPSQRYTIWTGLIGGTFLALSYFGTDQSQVQRYLAGSSVTASRWGLIFNAVLKIPMQFSILLLGVLLFVFYQFQQPPIFYNVATIEQVAPEVLAPIESQFQSAFETRGTFLETALSERHATGAARPETRAAILQQTELMELQRGAFKQAVSTANPDADTQDADYIFLHFVLDNLPAGLVGLLVAVIFLAAMSSTASELNALASTTMIDGYKTLVHQVGSDAHYVWVARILTLVWGLVAVSFAMTLTLFDNLIEAVNIIGSLFYGTILGIFLVAFFLKRIRGHAAFIGGVCVETIVLFLYFSPVDIGYLWFNLIGCILAVVIALLVQSLLNIRPNKSIQSL